MRRLLAYLVVAVAGFMIAYLVAAFVVLKGQGDNQSDQTVVSKPMVSF